MPPRLLISATASSTLLVEIGPQIPGDPQKVRKLPTRNVLRAPPVLENPELRDRSEGWVTGEDRFRNICGGIGGPPGPAKLAIESTPPPSGVVHRFNTRHCDIYLVRQISYLKILKLQQLKCI